jgi:hypothetical protein
MSEKQKLLYKHTLIIHYKNSCNLTFLAITKSILKRIHFYGLYMLYEKADLNEVKINETAAAVELLR